MRALRVTLRMCGKVLSFGAPLGPFLAERFGRLGSGAGDLASLCGFDALSALDQMALAVPSAAMAAEVRNGTDAVEFVAGPKFNEISLVTCAKTKAVS